MAAQVRGMDVPDARKLKWLEAENTKLKKILAEQMLVIEGLKEFSGKLAPRLEGGRRWKRCRAGGLSERAACRYLGLSRRVTGYELRQPVKDKTLGERLMDEFAAAAAIRLPQDRAVAGCEPVPRETSLEAVGAAAAKKKAAAPALRHRHSIAWCDAPQQRLVL